MIVGLVTPLASLAIASTMVVATLSLIGRGEPFVSPHGQSWEASSFYFIASLVVALLGPRLISLDAVLFSLRLLGAGRSQLANPS